MSDVVNFYELDNEGKEVFHRVISTTDIWKCPSVILLPSHYREDGTCRHDEPTCEQEYCRNEKYDGEIYCEYHLEQFGYI